MQDCTHNHSVLTRFLQTNGVYSYRFQCQVCFQPVGNNQKKPDDHESLPVFDVSKRDAWHQAAYRSGLLKWQQEAAEKAAAADKAWRERYNAHMNSPEWFALRRKVLDRAGGTCEGCGVRKATQVHHLTYARLGREMLFDLVAVCSQCHESIHAEE